MHPSHRPSREEPSSPLVPQPGELPVEPDEGPVMPGGELPAAPGEEGPSEVPQ